MSIMANNKVLSFLDHVNNELKRRYPGDQLVTQQVRSLGRWVVDCLSGRFVWFS